jgi:hypothetical protein
LEGRNNNTENLNRSKEKQKGTKKKDQVGPDNPEYGAGKH